MSIVKYIFSSLLLILFVGLSYSQDKNSVNWISFEEAVELNNKGKKKKILVDVYTDWCGWCKKMEASTYTDPAIVEYINDNYYAVKLNAERTDTVMLGEQMFVNKNPNGRRSPHDLAISLLNGKLTYPSTVLLDENVQLLNPPIAGYLTAAKIEPILYYFGENYHSKKVSWDEFQKNFTGKVK